MTIEMVDDEPEQTDNTEPAAGLSALELARPEIAGMVKTLVRELHLEGAKDRIRAILDKRAQLQREIERLDNSRAELAAQLQTIETELAKLEAGDLSVLDKSEAYDCAVCRMSTFNQFAHACCPNCGAAPGETRPRYLFRSRT